MKTTALLAMTMASLALALGMAGCATENNPNQPKATMTESKVEKMSFGQTLDGKPVDLYVLTNVRGMVAKVMTYGAILTELDAPDRKGKLDDVVLGFDTLDGYLKEHPYFGANVGRVANRIAKGKFTLNGKDYALAINNGPNSLHGGLKGFDKVVWKGEEVSVKDGVAVRFSYLSPNGEEGYPGNLNVTVTYTLTDKNELRIDYKATTDADTIINLCNHSYFNLAGAEIDNILGHEVMISANYYTPVDANLIPTGEIKPVEGAPLDFRKSTAIGARLEQVKIGDNPSGYDHNYVLTGGGVSLDLAARVTEPRTGRIMEVYTTEPGVQFYTGNFLDGTLKGKKGVVYKKNWGLCLETQHFPDSINHPNFPTTVLKKGQTYNHTVIYSFTAK